MADTEFGTNDAQTVKKYSTKEFRETMRATFIFRLLGDGEDSIIQLKDDLVKGSGDVISYDLVMQATDDGVTGDNEVRRTGQAITFYNDTVKVDQLRKEVSFRRMSAQRTAYNLRKIGGRIAKDWAAGKIDDYMFRYLCGDTTINHGQSGVDPDNDHYIITGDVTHTGTIATDEANLGSNDQIDLMDLDYAKEKAETITPQMLPAVIDGKQYWVAILHPYSMTDVRTAANGSATIKWPEIQQYANVRGLKNPIFTDADGVYNNIILFRSSRIFSSPNAATANTVRRNLFLGKQAGVMAVANPYDNIDQKKYGKNLYMSWYEGTADGGNEKYMIIGMVFGIKACVFNSKFFGDMVISSYAASH